MMSNSLSDRERILSYIIHELRSMPLHMKANIPWSSEAYRKSRVWGEGYHPHFAPWKKPEKGDLVICETSGIHHGTIGIIKQLISYDEALIQGVGDYRCIRVSNDRFIPIVGIDLCKDVFLCGEEWIFYLKVRKAFKRGDEYMYAYNGIQIQENKAIISIRCRGFPKEDQQPFNIEVIWNKKTTIKYILSKMIDGGYGSKYSRSIYKK
jgi:hypothetical protein